MGKMPTSLSVLWEHLSLRARRPMPMQSATPSLAQKKEAGPVTTYEEVMEDIATGIRDTIGDNPDVSVCDAAHDIAVNQFFRSDIPDDVKQDLARCYLGWDPEDDTDLYERHRIPLPKA